MTPRETAQEVLGELLGVLSSGVDGLTQSACFTCGAEPGCNIDCRGCQWVVLAQSAIAKARELSALPPADAVCKHGTALDVHCCNCHSGFLFDKDHICPEPAALLTQQMLPTPEAWKALETLCEESAKLHLSASKSGKVEEYLATRNTLADAVPELLRAVSVLTAENERLKGENKRLSECPSLMCPYEAEVAALKGRSSCAWNSEPDGLWQTSCGEHLADPDEAGPFCQHCGGRRKVERLEESKP